MISAITQPAEKMSMLGSSNSYPFNWSGTWSLNLSGAT